jgi:hypothetical protein
VTSEMPAAEPSATAEMDSWIATPRLSRASLADDWGTIE